MVSITFRLDQECVKTPEKAFGTASQHIHKAVCHASQSLAR
jgi:hypothetical protein